MEQKMKTLSKTGFSILSDELFSSFFSSDKAVTERIINIVLDGEFHVDGIEECEIDREHFGFYHPFVLIDAHTKSGRCVIAATFIARDREDATSDILDWMYYRVTLVRRNIYPVLISFDLTDSFPSSSSPVSLRIIDSDSIYLALVVVWIRMKKGRSELLALLEDLCATEEERINDAGIRCAYKESYEKSGLGEMEKVSYSMWLRSIRSDMEKLGIAPD